MLGASHLGDKIIAAQGYPHNRNMNDMFLPRKAMCLRVFAVLIIFFAGLSPLRTAFANTAQPAPALEAAGTVSGVIYRDLNFTAQRDGNEPFVQDVTVSAYDPNNALIASTQTSSNGSYSLPNVPFPARIELSTLPNGLVVGLRNPTNPDGGSLVREVTQATSNLNFALVSPTDWCGLNPDAITSCFVFGNPASSIYTSTPTVLSFPYSAGVVGNTNTGVRNPINHTTKLPARSLGSVWGLAYQRETGLAFASAFTKRHAGFGTLGTGGIYLFDPVNNTATPFADLNTLVPNSTGNNPHDLSNYFLDNGVWDAVGKTSLGGLDLSDDGETLWVMSLFDRKLYRLPVGAPPQAPTASQVMSYTLPNPGTGAEGCVLDPQTPNGALNLNLHPFAVKTFGNAVFVGMVCSAESNQSANSLRAFVFRLDVVTGAFTTAANFALNYPRGCMAYNNGTCASAKWLPWVNIQTLNLFAPFQHYTYPQPMLTDIEFDDAGNMLVALSDRMGHQTGDWRKEFAPVQQSPESATAGDLLKLEKTQSGAYQLEQNARAGGVQTNGSGNGQGPGNGEFYFQDHWQLGDKPNEAAHQELVLGGIAVKAGSGQVLATAFNPAPVFADVEGKSTLRTTGLLWFNNSTGERNRSYMLLQNEDLGYFSYSSGLGDVELLCDAAPIEVGNRVWRDANGNGIQDPGEGVISGVSVRLYDASGNLIASTTTDSQGRYSFSSIGPDAVPFTPDDLGNFGTDGYPNTPDDAFLPGFKPSTSRSQNKYFVRLDNAANYGAGQPLAGVVPTAPKVNSGANSDMRDSDAQLTNGFPQIEFISGRSGQNNDALDFGMVPPAKTSGLVWIDANADGIRENTDALVAGTPVTAFGPGIYVLTVTTNISGEYAFNSLPPGNYTFQFGVPTGYTFTQSLIGDPTTNSDVVNANGRTQPFTLVSGDSRTNIDSGLRKLTAALQLKAFTNGEDADSVPGPSLVIGTPVTWTYVVTNTGESPLSNLVVSDNRVGVATCPSNQLAPGANITCTKTGFVLNTQYTNTATATAQFVAPTFTSNATSVDLSHYLGIAGASIGDYVWFDFNRNGKQDTDELPLSGVTVTLLSTNNGVLASTRTDGDGRYKFSLLAPGSYTVEFSRLAGYTFASATVPTATPSLDSDADPGTGRTQPITLAIGENNTNIDAGMFTDAPGIRVRVLVNDEFAFVPPGPNIEAGAPTNFIYIVDNVGQFPLNSIVLNDAALGAINCPLSSLQPGQQVVCAAGATAVRGLYTSTATVRAVSTNIVAVNHASPIYYTGLFPSLVFNKTAFPPEGERVKRNEFITYQLTIQNNGAFTATNVVITDPVQSGLSFVVGSASQPLSPQDVVTTSGQLRITLGNLGIGETRTLTFTLQASAPTFPEQSIYTNTAYAQAQFSPIQASNTVQHVFATTAVSLLGFTAEQFSGAVRLRWQTATELNTFGFVVLRNTVNNYATAQPISPMQTAKGNQSKYEFVDGQNASGYYWLQEFEINGTPVLYGPATVLFSEINPLPAPNPANANETAGVAGVVPPVLVAGSPAAAPANTASQQTNVVGVVTQPAQNNGSQNSVGNTLPNLPVPTQNNNQAQPPVPAVVPKTQTEATAQNNTAQPNEQLVVGSVQTQANKNSTGKTTNEPATTNKAVVVQPVVGQPSPVATKSPMRIALNILLVLGLALVGMTLFIGTALLFAAIRDRRN